MFYLAKYENSSNLKPMVNEADSVEQVLEWYICAGVEETCGDVPFAMAPAEKAVVPKPAASVLSALVKKPAEPTPVRQATTGLAQATLNATQNAKDLCASIDSLDELRKAVENFDGCALKLTASHTVFGDGNPQARVVFIGEAPGADEDRIGVPFVGRSGHLLDKMLAAVHMDRTQYYITNILPWRPPGNRTPLDSEIAVCLPFLKRQLDIINPDFIFTLGGSAANALLDTADSISKMRGRWMEYTKSNGQKAMVLASFHPAYLLRTPGQKAKAWSDVLRLYKQMNSEKES